MDQVVGKQSALLAEERPAWRLEAKPGGPRSCARRAPSPLSS